MTTSKGARPNVEEVLATLKDFQRDTVDYVFRRLYLGPDKVSRFLIADEVGLGKTLVARGIIAKAVDRLWDDIERIDVIYICSNQDIAQQNIDRLNITSDRHFQFASRSTLLPITIEELRGNKLNFVSFTPRTSLDMRSSGGIWRERALLYYLLREVWGISEGALQNTLRGGVEKGNWKDYLGWYREEISVDTELKERFLEALDQDGDLRDRFEVLAREIGGRRIHIPPHLGQERNRLVGRLRRLLAHESLSALEPDLVILDEFQRFKYLLDADNDMAMLAQELFQFPEVKVLLLSATPYKMYTRQGEDENHYEDFYRTAGFLLQDPLGELSGLEDAIEQYRRAMLNLNRGDYTEIRSIKDRIERILCKVMVRTEKLAASADRNGMLSETLTAQSQVEPADLEGFVRLDHIATFIDAGDQVEYWKSSSYPLNLMEDYKLKREFKTALTEAPSDRLTQLLADAQRHLLTWGTIEQYQQVDPGNARLRALVKDTLDTGNWRVLWMPASLPYYCSPDGPFAQIRPNGLTKSLIFSAWRIVPKVVAMLVSYEAERRMLNYAGVAFAYSELTRKRRQLLRFTRSKDRLTGMPVLSIVYPCLTLAQRIDPLAIARRLSDGETPSMDAVFEVARREVGQLLDLAASSVEAEEAGPPDESWYWAVLALLDRHFNWEHVNRWLDTDDHNLAWRRMLDIDPDEPEENRFEEHVDEFAAVFRSPPKQLGRQPDNLVDIVTLIALSAPGTITLRALLRTMPPASPSDLPALLASAARGGLAFRSLFNQPENISLLQALYPEDAYWLKVLQHGLEGNVQAVMDEYFHILYESLGLIGHDPAESAGKVAEALETALSLRSPTLRFDEIVLPSDGHGTRLESRGIRCRYALRFGDERTDDDFGSRTRAADVRIAFNSPFRPFVLATTSIGQEGLDFHQYCHRVVHWNLPSNPVDLEQREGRVHRYKGHVIRRNLALRYGLSVVANAQGNLVDPWQQLFHRAVRDRLSGDSDLIPFWIYELPEGFSIERRVPVLPLSRELGHIERLKKALVAYRSVIGQPRQQDLLEFLSTYLSDDEIRQLVAECAIDLSPPHAREPLAP